MAFVIWLLVSIAFVILGIYAYVSKKEVAFGFWANADTFSVNLPYPSEGRQTENHSHRKLIKLITWTPTLSNSMKL